MKPSLIVPGVLACALWAGQTATAADPAGTQQRVSGSGFTALLLADGTVCVAPQPAAAPAAPCRPVPRLRGIVQIAAQGPHLVARQSDGRVWAWQPAGLPLPRPVRGLPGKVSDVSLAADGQLRVSVLRHEPYGLEPVEDRSGATLAPYALRGEVLCAAGRPAAGLPILLASIQSIEPVLSLAAPALARLRAVAGRCALELGDRAAALRQAELARAAFTAQPQVSGWYRLPLGALERALKAR